MEIINGIRDVEGVEFPAGRRTRVLVGVDSSLQAKHFVQGLVVIYPGGSVPLHTHDTEETYFILEGEGEMVVDGKSRAVGENDIIYIEPFLEHSLTNVGDSDMRMMFVYAPAKVVDHWAEEQAGTLS